MKRTLFFIFVFFVSCGLSRAVEWNTEIYRIRYVVDGDTVILGNHEHVRLIGIDAPEVRDNKKLRRDVERTGKDARTIMAMGRRSADFARELLDGKEVRLEYDVQKRDKYGRVLAYLFLDTGVPLSHEVKPVKGYQYQAGAKDWELFVNATLVGSGYATPYTIPPNVHHASLFRKLYKEALREKRGLWAKP